MTDDVFRALTYPLETGDIAFPVQGRILLINMRPGGVAGTFPAARTVCWNWDKWAADCWADSGYDVAPVVPDGTFATIFLALPQQRDAALGLIAQAATLLGEDGVLVVAAANDSGGHRIAGDMSPFCAGLQMASKHKCRIVWARQADLAALPVSWIEKAAPQYHAGSGMWTRPGIFSWDRMDVATALLIPFVPQAQDGVFVDPGCGNGVLACEVLRRNPDAARLLACDVDFHAVEACRRNVAACGSATAVEIGWKDFTKTPARKEADWVIMNPPFHRGKTEAVALGQDFISCAAAWLKPGGVLLMVANAHLPYEKILQDQFSSVEKRHEGQGFKIFQARL